MTITENTKIRDVNTYALFTNRVVCMLLDTVKTKRSFRLINMHNYCFNIVCNNVNHTISP